MTPSIFARLTAPLRRAITMMVARCVIELVKDAPKVQEVQIALLADEVRSDVERFQNYGLTSVPLPGMEAVALSVGGNRDHMIVVAIGDRLYRLKDLAAGEVALYDHLGNFVHLKANGTIHIKASRVEVEATTVVLLSGDVNLGAEGGKAIARVGDMVAVGSGSSAGNWPIISGSSVAKAAD
jgi:phage baseplate assembly protein V